MIEINEEILSDVYKERPIDSRKYDFGLVVVIGGSDFYSGSPALSAMAAFRAGADMVRIIAPKRAADIVASFSPNMAAYPLEGKYLTKNHLPILISMTEAAKVASRGHVSVVLGGGIGRSDETQEAILGYLSGISSTPVVIDADAISVLKGSEKVLKDKECIITPHYNEFFRLTERDVYDLTLEEKVEAVKEAATKIGATILLKGSVDIVSDGKEVILNRLGSPFMTVGGCGDTLAGIAGAMKARGIPTIRAAAAAAYINAKAGSLAAEKMGDSLVATDLIESISSAIKK